MHMKGNKLHNSKQNTKKKPNKISYFQKKTEVRTKGLNGGRVLTLFSFSCHKILDLYVIK